MKTNKEGLTYLEWFNAATRFNANAVSWEAGRKHWRLGVDPTEFAVIK